MKASVDQEWLAKFKRDLEHPQKIVREERHWGNQPNIRWEYAPSQTAFYCAANLMQNGMK